MSENERVARIFEELLELLERGHELLRQRGAALSGVAGELDLVVGVEHLDHRGDRAARLSRLAGSSLAVGAAAGLMFWPWPAQCGGPLIGFTAATGAVALLGVWSAVGTWRHRLGLAHVASLLVVVWGLVLGAREVLPRAGYAIPTAERSEGWSCPAPSGIPAPVLR